MIKLDNVNEFRNRFGVGKKWIRCGEAIDNIPNIRENTYYNIGDSLVYIFKTSFKPENELFQGHRRYLDIHVFLEGEEEIEISKKENLNCTTPYSDENDYEYFQGAGEKHTFKNNEVVIFENNEAFKSIGKSDDLKKLIIKVTIEDNSLLNK